jgi:sugar phosphate isomerase/epimerase
MKHYSSRRQFIKTSTGFLALAFAGTDFIFNKKEMKLSFSTLGCPDWPFEKIVSFATANNYSGIEVRGIQREMYLPKCKEFSAENIGSTVRLMKDNHLRFVDLGSSAEMHHSDAAERKKNLDEAKRFIDLAQKLECPYVRVFPNKLPKESRDATLELIAEGLREIGDFAKGSNVMVLLETHGEIVESSLIKQIMDKVNHPKVGLVWDVTNMWTVAKEPPAQVYAVLKNYIHHTHIKDAKLIDGTPHYTLLGQGDVPIFEAIDILRKGGYEGYFSFEWEKLWHPEIGEPEIAIADFPKAIRNHFKK